MTQNDLKPIVREITANDLQSDTGVALRQHLIDGELVHPPRSDDTVTHYMRRISQELSMDGLPFEKHCYGLFGPDANKPSAAVYVKFMTLPTRRHTGPNGEERAVVNDADLPGNINGTLYGENQLMETAPNTAIFYSISSFSSPKIDKTLLNGVRAGEYLIKAVAKKLHDEHGITKFSTLSPLRQRKENKDGSVEYSGFRPWLEKNLSTTSDSKKYFTRDEIRTIERLANHIDYKGPDDIGQKFIALAVGQASLSHTDQQRVHTMLRMLAMDYLISLPRNQHFEQLDGVEDFHLGNGAKIGNIHVKPPQDTTELEWDHAFGVMVNYVYELEKVPERKDRFQALKRTPAESGLDNLQRISTNIDMLAEYRTRQATLQREHGAQFLHRIRSGDAATRAL